MTYRIALTHDERKAFDWVGSRYDSTGQRMADLLLSGIPEHMAWDDPEEIVFVISETTAWEMRELAEEEEYSWPCFSDKLASKMNVFCDSIV